MDTFYTVLVDALIIALILLGVRSFRSPRGALRGNLVAAAALALAVAVVVLRHPPELPVLVAGLLVLGGLVGWWVAVRVSMIQTPALVAAQHGAGAVAAFLVCTVELVRSAGPGVTVDEVSGLTGLALGAATFSGSVVAAGKLANVFSQPPQLLPGHNRWLSLLAAVLLAVVFVAGGATSIVPALLVVVMLAMAIGMLVAVRVGGADMPVLISFLNATAGLAAAFAGVVIGNRLLVAAGATVAASGSVLTIAMCRAMNRSLLAVFRGFRPVAPGPAVVALADTAGEGGGDAPAEPTSPGAVAPLAAAAAACARARSVIIVPGYGMAMAQAQFEVVELARLLEARGKRVRFAIHPVAGRMPGHMHVLLSEAEAPWEQLCELPDINDDFASTDLVIIVGASDVVNPAAIRRTGTPISGMPILKAHEAGRVLIINLDDRPGYSGVRNLLYDDPGSILVWGDARGSLRQLLDELAAAGEPVAEVGGFSTA